MRFRQSHDGWPREFVVGKYARSRYDGSCIYEVIAAGKVRKFVEDDFPEKDRHFYSNLINKDYFQENVILRKFGETSKINGFKKSHSWRTFSLYYKNFRGYVPSEIRTPEPNFALVKGEVLYFDSLTSIDLSKVRSPYRIIDMSNCKVLQDGVWHKITPKE